VESGEAALGGIQNNAKLGGKRSRKWAFHAKEGRVLAREKTKYVPGIIVQQLGKRIGKEEKGKNKSGPGRSEGEITWEQAGADLEET